MDKQKQNTLVGLMAALCVVALVIVYGARIDNEIGEVEIETATTTTDLPPVVTHTVKKGQSLVTIARDWAPNGTSGLDLVRLNEEILAPVFVERCGDLSEAFRTRDEINFTRWKKGGGDFFCNEKKGNDNFPSWANSLLPGDIIFLPTTTSTESIQVFEGQVAKDVNSSVASLTGERIILVIDASGSMSEESDQAKVANLYNTLLTERVAGIVMFAENPIEVRAIDEYPLGLGIGSVENIAKALTMAKAMDADEIVLIGDEQGDDVDGFTFVDIPPVNAHCLPDPADLRCADTFKRIALESGGRYIE